MKYQNLTLLIFFILNLCYPAFAQQNKVDSLNTLLKKRKQDDTSKVNLLNQLGDAYSKIDYTKSIESSQKALKIAKKLDFKIGVANSYKYLGLFYSSEGKHKKAISYSAKALKIYQAEKDLKLEAATLYQIARAYYKNSRQEKAMTYYNKTIIIGKKAKDLNIVANAYSGIGVLFRQKNNYKKTLENYFKALKLFKQLKDKQGVGLVYNNIGVTYEMQSKYTEAIKYYFKSLSIKKSIGDIEGSAYTYGNLGIVYITQKEYTQAEKYLKKALKIFQESNSLRAVAYVYESLAKIQQERGNDSKALNYYRKALKIEEDMNDWGASAYVYKSMADVYTNIKEYNKALNYYKEAKKIFERLENKEGIIYVNQGLGEIFLIQKNFVRAEKYFQTALETSQEIDYKDEEKKTYLKLFKLDSTQNKLHSAIRYYQKYVAIKDSLFNKNKNKQLLEIRSQYELDEKEKENLLLKKEKKIQTISLAQEKSRKTRAQIVAWTIGVILLLVIILATMFYRQRQLKQKANILLQDKNSEIARQTEELKQNNEEIRAINEALEVSKNDIERKNKDIRDSINYAKRIQDAILPPIEDIQIHIPKTFIIFKPKDIVSGDFYWFGNNNNKLVIALVDCTGHGIPGAFMSMSANTMLNQIVMERDILRPHKILENLHKYTHDTLKTQKTSVRDGMDVTMITIDKKTKTLEFSGANLPLYYIEHNEKNELKIIKGDRISIGGEQLEKERIFTAHKLQLKNKTTIYLTSDGYQDQFGGNNGKKFMKSKLREMFLKIYQKDISTQKQILEQTLTKWKGNTYAQVDDITVLGIEVKL